MTSSTASPRSAIRNAIVAAGFVIVSALAAVGGPASATPAVVPQREIGAPASVAASAFQIGEAMSQPLSRRGPF